MRTNTRSVLTLLREFCFVKKESCVCTGDDFFKKSVKPCVFLKHCPLNPDPAAPPSDPALGHVSPRSSAAVKWTAANREHLQSTSIPSQDLETQMSYETQETALCGGGEGGRWQRFGVVGL